MIGHNPRPPGWTCFRCGDPWPCKPRQEKFLTDYQGRRRELRVVLSAFFTHALEDLADAPVDELHKRFVGWATQPRTPKP